MSKLTFLRSYDSSPRQPSSPPTSPFHKLSLFLSIFVCHRLSLLTGEWGEGSTRGTKSYDREKSWPSLNHSILSGVTWHSLCTSKGPAGWWRFRPLDRGQGQLRAGGEVFLQGGHYCKLKENSACRNQQSTITFRYNIPTGYIHI